MRPGKERQVETHTHLVWEDIKGHFRSWLWNLREEVESPDLWEQLVANRQAVASLTSSSDHHNAPFTVAEQQELRARIDEVLAQAAATHNLTAAQAAAGACACR